MAITTLSTKTTEAEAREEMLEAGGCNLRRCMGYGETAERFWLFDYAVGMVLDTYEMNGYDDSDFYAIIWDEKKNEIEHVLYATTRGWTYPCGARPDASEEVKQMARESMRSVVEGKIRYTAETAAKKVEKGRTVRVVRGRKVPIGTEGEVFWVGDSGYGLSVGIKTWDGTYVEYTSKFGGGRMENTSKCFTSAKNVEVVNWKNYMLSEADIEYRTNYFLKTANFRSLTY